MTYKTSTGPMSLWTVERTFRQRVLAHALAITKGNRTRAAALLGLERTYFCRLVRGMRA